MVLEAGSTSILCPWHLRSLIELNRDLTIGFGGGGTVGMKDSRISESVMNAIL